MSALAENIYLNDLVSIAGIDPAEIRLIRHAERNPETGESSWTLWRSGDRRRFDLHQSLYNTTHPMGRARYTISFVATPENGTLFVGMWEVGERRLSGEDVLDPVVGEPRRYVYDLHPSRWLGGYVGRLSVAWSAPRSWYRDLSKTRFPVEEIRRAEWAGPFPEYVEFRARVSEVSALPGAWQEVLAACRGVYLLVGSDGEQYVGSATGERGFLGRWLDYAQDGHGGNQALRERERQDYHVSILEVCGTALSLGEIHEREGVWKRKLGSRAHGLNRN